LIGSYLEMALHSNAYSFKQSIVHLTGLHKSVEFQLFHDAQSSLLLCLNSQVKKSGDEILRCSRLLLHWSDASYLGINGLRDDLKYTLLYAFIPINSLSTFRLLLICNKLYPLLMQDDLLV
jgi:hypothetical protein